MSDDFSRPANAASAALTVAGYRRDSLDFVQAERLRLLLGSSFLPYLVGVCEEMEKRASECVLADVLPVHALATYAIEELAEK